MLRDFEHCDTERLAIQASENARRCLAGGVTTVRDCGGYSSLTQTLRDAVNQGILVGPRILSCGNAHHHDGGHCPLPRPPRGLGGRSTKSCRQLVETRADFIKVMATGGRMTRDSNTLQLQYSPETLEMIASEAHRLSRRVAAHVLSTEGIRVCVDAQIDTLEHCRWQDETEAFDYDEAVLSQMARQGTYVSLTMAGNIRDLLLEKRRTPQGFTLGPVERERFRTEADMFNRGSTRS